MSNLPTIILVHGFQGGAAHWGKVILEPKRLSHDSLHIVELPLTLLTDDVERTRKIIAQQQGPVLLVGRSYGGAVITGTGSQPNVVGLIYITTFVPGSGESPGGIAQEHLPLAAANLTPSSDGYLWVRADRFHESLCQDLVADEGLVMDITWKIPLTNTLGDAIGSPAWKSRPSWYQVFSANHTIAPENQEWMAAWVTPRETVTLDASHASLASRAEGVAVLIDKAAMATVR